MVGAPGVVGRGDRGGRRRGRPGADAVDGGHREGVGGAVGQAGDRLGGGRRVEGLGGLGHAGDVGGDHVAGDGRPAVGARSRPAEGDRGIARGGRHAGRRPGVVAGVTEADAADCVPVPTPLMAATLKV